MINQEEPFFGDRGNSFKNMIQTILKKANLKQHYIDLLTDEDSLIIYGTAFTHQSIDSLNNYEFMELLGDQTINKSIVWYFSRRFPELNCPEGVKIISRLKIKYVGKKKLALLAEPLGFWDFISADVAIKKTQKKPLLEDVFEAFIGTTEYLIDSKIRQGAGYSICYDIIANVFDSIEHISLAYRDLFDAKTILKETFDVFPSLGKLVYENEKEYTEEQFQFQIVSIYRIKNERKIFLAKEKACLLIDAQQKAANIALDVLANQGYSKPIARVYNNL